MFDRKHNEGKRAFRKWKWLPAACALALALTVTVGGTLAWLAAHTDPVTNTFKMGEVTPEVEETFDPEIGKVKENVRVQNKGDVPAYIRVALVATWEDKNGNVKPASLSDLTITWGGEGGDLGDGWIQIGEYYYHQAPVNGQAFTGYLIKSAEVNGAEQPEGYHMNLQIIADSIQAMPTSAVEGAWHVKVTDGNITGTNSAG